MPADIGYYDNARHDALSLLPERVERVLEIGCGTGATLAVLKSAGRCAWAGGVELAELPGRQAADRLDRVWPGDIETLALDIPHGSLDAVLCLDVLEHLRDPWAVSARLAALLKPGGIFITSIPNVRNHRVIRDLLVKGTWTYRDSGIMDRTHLRFFTRRTGVELVAGAGLSVTRVTPLVHLKPWSLKRLIRRLAVGRMDEFYAEQFLIAAIKP